MLAVSPRIEFIQGTRRLEELAPRGVALDGVVPGPVMGDDQDRWSFDHHADCHRLITAATCEQVYIALALGFDMTDRVVYVNDLDGDTIMSLWLCKNPSYAINGDMNTHTLVRAVAIMDAHGPAGKRLMTARERRYSDAFFSAFRDYSRPGYAQQRFEAWPQMVDEAMEMVWRVYRGEIAAPTVEDSAVFEITHHIDRPRMCLAHASGAGAFDGVYKMGFQIATLSSHNPDGSRVYTIGKVSDLVPYKLGPTSDPTSLLGQLAAKEPGWGGGSSIGGSPRPDGSKLSPDDVWKLMTAVAASSPVIKS